MRLVRLPRRALVRWYTVAIALICGAAITMVVHDLPASRAAAERRAQATAWKSELAAARARVAAVDATRLRLRRAYNQLVLTSHAREAAAARERPPLATRRRPALTPTAWEEHRAPFPHRSRAGRRRRRHRRRRLRGLHAPLRTPMPPTTRRTSLRSPQCPPWAAHLARRNRPPGCSRGMPRRRRRRSPVAVVVDSVRVVRRRGTSRRAARRRRAEPPPPHDTRPPRRHPAARAPAPATHDDDEDQTRRRASDPDRTAIASARQRRTDDVSRPPPTSRTTATPRGTTTMTRLQRVLCPALGLLASAAVLAAIVVHARAEAGRVALAEADQAHLALVRRARRGGGRGGSAPRSRRAGVVAAHRDGTHHAVGCWPPSTAPASAAPGGPREAARRLPRPHGAGLGGRPVIAWEITRASAFVAFGCYTLSVTWGILVASRTLPAPAKPEFDYHRFLSSLGLAATAIHVVDGADPPRERRPLAGAVLRRSAPGGDRRRDGDVADRAAAALVRAEAAQAPLDGHVAAAALPRLRRLADRVAARPRRRHGHAVGGGAAGYGLGAGVVVDRCDVAARQPPPGAGPRRRGGSRRRRSGPTAGRSATP